MAMPTGPEDVRSRGSHGRTAKMTRMTLSGHAATRNSGLPRSTSCASNTPDSHAAMWYASTSI
jgi:hypothetical protein